LSNDENIQLGWLKFALKNCIDKDPKVFPVKMKFQIGIEDIATKY
jgi:hypothetical protein